MPGNTGKVVLFEENADNTRTCCRIIKHALIPVKFHPSTTVDYVAQTLISFVISSLRAAILITVGPAENAFMSAVNPWGQLEL